MNKKFIKIVAALSIVWAAICLSVYFWPIPKDRWLNDNVKDAYLTTCRVDIDDAIGNSYVSTGVLLKTGYILTAAHSIDLDKSGTISEIEKHPIITFFGSIASVHTGTVIFVGNEGGFDIAAIELDSPPESDVELVTSKFGDKLFTIGMTNGDNPNLSYGNTSSYTGGHARASIAAWVGNSGGGLWNSDQELVGIASSVGLARNLTIVTIPVPIRDGIMIMRGRVETQTPLANWLGYISSGEIKQNLDKKNLSFIYEVPKQTSYLSTYSIVGKCAVQILMVLLCVSFFKKSLFS